MVMTVPPVAVKKCSGYHHVGRHQWPKGETQNTGERIHLTRFTTLLEHPDACAPDIACAGDEERDGPRPEAGRGDGHRTKIASTAQNSALSASSDLPAEGAEGITSRIVCGRACY